MVNFCLANSAPTCDFGWLFIFFCRESVLCRFILVLFSFLSIISLDLCLVTLIRRLLARRWSSPTSSLSCAFMVSGGFR
ncbi:unnamed protein product [Arabidopsis halleri]